MAKDALFTNGIIAVKEKRLLKDKLFRMCEMSADEAFRLLSDSGFGGGESVSSPYEIEKLVEADSRDIDAFIREFAPSDAEKSYLLSPRDFHNAKALTKAEYLKTDAANMLAPEGLVPVEKMRSCFQAENFSPLNEELKGAILQARAYFAEGGASGAEAGAIFEKALYRHLSAACAHNRVLRKFVKEKADMTNILTALRAGDEASAAKYYVEGGNLSRKQLVPLFSGGEAAKKALQGEERDFVRLCLEARENSHSLSEAERMKDSYETDALAKNKYDLKANQPFLYYVFRRRAENENVRIVFVCLLNGMAERDIKRRLRGV